MSHECQSALQKPCPEKTPKEDGRSHAYSGWNESSASECFSESSGREEKTAISVENLAGGAFSSDLAMGTALANIRAKDARAQIFPSISHLFFKKTAQSIISLEDGII